MSAFPNRYFQSSANCGARGTSASFPLLPKSRRRNHLPGIVGLISKMPREQAEPELMRMVEALRHESFYVTGTLVDEPLGVYVGWVARKDSFSDGMPLRNERGDVALVFSGEEFREPETARRLKERG